MDKKKNYTDPESVPEEIRGWSWGACLLNGVWGVGNRTWSALLAFVPVINIVMMFILGLNGRKWAWKNKQWDNVEHFNRVQKKWDIAGFVALGLYIFVFIRGLIGIL